jgi:hypothetical protein
MEETKILLLLKLIDNLKESFADFQKAYNSSDKEGIDNYKKNILDIQKKIKVLSKQN